MAYSKEKKSFYFEPELREAFEGTLQTSHEGSVRAGAALFLWLASQPALQALAREYSSRKDVKQAIEDFQHCLETEGLNGPVAKAIVARIKKQKQGRHRGPVRSA